MKLEGVELKKDTTPAPDVAGTLGQSKAEGEAISNE